MRLEITSQERPESPDLAAVLDAAAAAGQPPGRTAFVLATDFWVQMLDLPAGRVRGLSDADVTQVLNFEAEVLSGLPAFEASAAAAALPSAGADRRYWLLQVRTGDRDRAAAVLRGHGSRLGGLLHPAGLPRGLGDAAFAGAVELWPDAAVAVRPAAGGVEVVVSNADPVTGRWRSELPDADGAEILTGPGVPPPPGTEPTRLDKLETLAAWFAAWAAELTRRRPAAAPPVVRPPVPPTPAAWKALLAAAAAAAAAAGLYAHWTDHGRQLADLKGRTDRAVGRAKQLADLEVRQGQAGGPREGRGRSRPARPAGAAAQGPAGAVRPAARSPFRHQAGRGDDQADRRRQRRAEGGGAGAGAGPGGRVRAGPGRGREAAGVGGAAAAQDGRGPGRGRRAVGLRDRLPPRRRARRPQGAAESPREGEAAMTLTDRDRKLLVLLPALLGLLGYAVWFVSTGKYGALAAARAAAEKAEQAAPPPERGHAAEHRLAAAAAAADKAVTAAAAAASRLDKQSVCIDPECRRERLFALASLLTRHRLTVREHADFGREVRSRRRPSALSSAGGRAGRPAPAQDRLRGPLPGRARATQPLAAEGSAAIPVSLTMKESPWRRSGTSG